jgi:hypothetical protein
MRARVEAQPTPGERAKLPGVGAIRIEAQYAGIRRDTAIVQHLHEADTAGSQGREIAASRLVDRAVVVQRWPRARSVHYRVVVLEVEDSGRTGARAVVEERSIIQYEHAATTSAVHIERALVIECARLQVLGAA